jgi:predicted acetyltransferase
MAPNAPISLEPVAFEDKAALREILDPYLIAHADLVDPLRVHGDPTVHEYFDLYWVEPQRRPHWITLGGERVGFVLVNAYSPSGLGVDHAISEFCVDPAHRRGGVGTLAVRAVLTSWPGLWELQTYHANLDGMAFWPRAIAAVRPAQWEVLEREDRVIHRFRTR